MSRPILAGLLLTMLVFQGCDRSPRRAALDDTAVEAKLGKMTGTPAYSFPEVEGALRQSLSLRTFRIPPALLKGEQAIWIQAKIGGEVFVGQPLDRDRAFITLCRSAHANELLYSSHSESEGFSGVLSLGETEVHGWKFNDPDPPILDARLVLASAGNAEVYIAIRTSEQAVADQLPARGG